MNSHGKRRFGRIFVGVLAATLAIPASAAAYVQIGGYLVAPSQVSAYQASADLAPSAGLMQIGGETDPLLSEASAWQASADLAPSAGLVQIGGELVAPSRLSAWQTDAWDLGWIVCRARWAEARFRIRLGRSRHYRSRRTRRPRAAARSIRRHAQAPEHADDAREHSIRSLGTTGFVRGGRLRVWGRPLVLPRPGRPARCG